MRVGRIQCRQPDFRPRQKCSRYFRQHLENLKKGRLPYGVTEIPAAVSLANQSVFCGFLRPADRRDRSVLCILRSKTANRPARCSFRDICANGATAKLIIDGTSELDAPVFSLEKNENLVGRRDPHVEYFSRGRSIKIRSANKDIAATRPNLARRRQFSRRGSRIVKRHDPDRRHQRFRSPPAASAACIDEW